MQRKQGIQLICILLIIVGLVLLPVAIKKESIINLIILILLYTMLGTSWNILGGYTGQTNLGHAAFFGLGSLMTRFLWMHGVNIFPSLLAGGLVAVAFGMLIGTPAFKLKGAYFAIGMLALGEVLNVTVGNLFPTISSLSAEYLGSYQLLPRYYLFVGLAVLMVGCTYFLVNSKIGLGMMAVREEEDAAESLGINARTHKLIALAASTFFAGIAGGAFAFYYVSYYPQYPFSPMWTFDSITMVYIGGTGTIIGPIIGAIFFVVLKELLALKLQELHIIVFAVLFISVVLFLPGGLVEVWTKLKRYYRLKWVSRKTKELPPST
jgi:branched-chain amino acid transport system permease protein